MATATNKLKLERWTSNQNQEELHYFIEGTGKGYQPNQYVFGYNPKVVTVKKIQDDLYELSISPRREKA